MTLYQLCQDEALLAELKEYFTKVLQEEAIKRVFAGDETAGVADAKLIIDEAFDTIEAQFGRVEEKSKVNNAR